jgi:L-lysine 2,3-aminomutase
VLQQLGALQTHTADTFLFISHTTNVLLFKSRCNIVIGVRIIKKLPGLVGIGTLCIKKNMEALAVASKEIELEVNADKIKYMVMSRERNAGQNHNIEIESKSFEGMAQLKNVGTYLTNQNSIH